MRALSEGEWLGSQLGNDLVNASRVSLFVGALQFWSPESLVAKAVAVESRVTIGMVREVIRSAQGRTVNTVVELPKIQRYVTAMRNGAVFPRYSLQGDIIVDGNHRWIASQIANVPLGAQSPKHWLTDMDIEQWGVGLRSEMKVDRRDWDVMEAAGSNRWHRSNEPFDFLDRAFSGREPRK